MAISSLFVLLSPESLILHHHLHKVCSRPSFLSTRFCLFVKTPPAFVQIRQNPVCVSVGVATAVASHKVSSSSKSFPPPLSPWLDSPPGNCQQMWPKIAIWKSGALCLTRRGLFAQRGQLSRGNGAHSAFGSPPPSGDLLKSVKMAKNTRME